MRRISLLSSGGGDDERRTSNCSAPRHRSKETDQPGCTRRVKCGLTDKISHGTHQRSVDQSSVSSSALIRIQITNCLHGLTWTPQMASVQADQIP